MSATEAANERARWRAPDGTVAVWRQDYLVYIRRGPIGGYALLGQAPTLGDALARVLFCHSELRQVTTTQGRSFSTRLSPPPTALPQRYFARFKDATGAAQTPPAASPQLRLGRIAAYALRRERQERETAARNGYTRCSGRGDNPRGSLHDEPLTIGEIVSALTRPDILAVLTVLNSSGLPATVQHELTQADIDAALAALCEPETASPPAGEPDDDDEN